MKRALKWLAIIVGGFLALAVVAAIAITAVGGSSINAQYDVTPQPLNVPVTDEDMARFRQLEQGLACTGCHGEDLGGDVFDEELGIYAPNLTTGTGGRGATAWSDEQLIRAIHHGINEEGQPLIFMPADQFSNLSERDLAAALEFVRGFPPVENEVPAVQVSAFIRFFMGLGQIPEGIILPATAVDHEAPYREHVEPGETAEYGQYLTSLLYCTHCHRSDFQGGPFPFPDPAAPVVPNITGAGVVGSWTLEEFRTTLRTGVTPYGKNLNQEYMSAEEFNLMTDEQLGAIYLFLQTQPDGE